MVRRIQASNTAKHPSHGISASFNHTYHSLFFYFYFFFFFFFFSLRLPSLRRSTVLFPREEHIYIYHILHLGRVLMYRPHSFCVFHYFYFIIIVLFVFFYFSSTYCFSHSPCLLNFHILFHLVRYILFTFFVFHLVFHTPMLSSVQMVSSRFPYSSMRWQRVSHCSVVFSSDLDHPDRQTHTLSQRWPVIMWRKYVSALPTISPREFSHHVPTADI